MGNLVKVARRDEVPEGTGKTVEAGGQPIALFNSGGRFYAIHNTCLHRNGPLGEGEIEGTTVVCPWHGWEYDITTGRLISDPAKKVACFSVQVQGDDILVEL